MEYTTERFLAHIVQDAVEFITALEDGDVEKELLEEEGLKGGDPHPLDLVTIFYRKGFERLKIIKQLGGGWQ